MNGPILHPRPYCTRAASAVPDAAHMLISLGRAYSCSAAPILTTKPCTCKPSSCLLPGQRGRARLEQQYKVYVSGATTSSNICKNDQAGNRLRDSKERKPTVTELRARRSTTIAQS